MKQTLTALTCFLSVILTAHAQLPEDALRMSWLNPSGTAREQAIGGAMGSLGGEISAAFVNPAGLALYRTGDFILSPGLRMLSSKGNYRGTSTTGTSTAKFNLGTSGFVLGFPKPDGSNGTFTIAVSQMADFNGHIHYKGQNNYSSYGEQYAEEFSQSGLSIDDAIFSSQVSYGTRMALYSYLIDTATVNGTQQVITLPLRAGLLNQDNSITTKGGITEVAISYAFTQKGKWFIGGSLGIPVVSYTRMQTFTETDATGNTNNDFASSTYTETYTSKGFGVNAKIGAIYRPATAWRIGLAVHTPTIYGLRDGITAAMTTNTENYAHEISINSATLNESAGITPEDARYDLYTPWKFIVSGSYLVGESEDVTRQKGFISFDAGYTTHGSSHFSQADNTSDAASYFEAVNSAVKDSYKGSFDLRLGGELKLNTFMARAGVAYYTNPYQDKQLKADRLYLSGGIGWRNKGMFADLTYVQGFSKDVNFPYRLADKANTLAQITQSSGTVLFTVGFKIL